MVLHLTWVLGIKKNGFWGQEKTTHITLGLWHYLKPEYLKATKINSCQVIGDKHVYHLKRWLTIRCCILQYPPLPRQQCDEELSFPPSISWLTCATIGWLERWLTSECRAICLRIDWATGRDWADRLGPGRVSCRYTHTLAHSCSRQQPQPQPHTERLLTLFVLLLCQFSILQLFLFLFVPLFFKHPTREAHLANCYISITDVASTHRHEGWELLVSVFCNGLLSVAKPTYILSWSRGNR